MDKLNYKFMIIEIPIQLHNEIKTRAAIRGMTLKKYVMQAVSNRIEKEKKYETNTND